MTVTKQKKKRSEDRKNNDANDTIAAIATASGIGGVGVIRISGPACIKIAESILGKTPKARIATFSRFKSEKQILDEGLAIYFPAPNSFTGEDVLELQGHGGPVILDMLLRAVLKQGARIAEPGEFSKRAFLSGKMDLTQAEAIADLINAHSETAAKSALRSLEGEFKNKVNSVVSQLIEVRKFVEAAIDFPEEEIDFLSDKNLQNQLDQLKQKINELEQQAQQGAILRQGINVVIAGEPNAGKSSLLNCLSGRDSAIVTEIPGTTRDVLREWISLDGVPMHIIDTAGLRETNDIIEKEGIKRAQQEIENADVILLVVDASKAKNSDIASEQSKRGNLSSKIRRITAYNKIDLINEKPRIEKDTVYLSAKQNEGVDLLKQKLLEIIGWQPGGEDTFIARRRHLDAIARAKENVFVGVEQFYQHKAGELLAEDLLLAQHALNEITGEFTSDDLLGKIFSEFCIGK